MYSHRCFYVFLQVFSCAPTSASRSLHEQLACMQAGLSPAPPCPAVAPCVDTVRCQKSGIEICKSEFLYRLSKGFVLYVGYSLGVS